MANNVILYHDTDPDTAQSLKVRTILHTSSEYSGPPSYLQTNVSVCAAGRCVCAAQCVLCCAARSNSCLRKLCGSTKVLKNTP